LAGPAYCRAGQRFSASAATETPRFTVLYDAFGNDAAMTQGLGLRRLVEIYGKRILFDTVMTRRFSRRTWGPKRNEGIVVGHQHADGIVLVVGCSHPALRASSPKREDQSAHPLHRGRVSSGNGRGPGYRKDRHNIA